MSKDRLRNFIGAVNEKRTPGNADLEFIATALKQILAGVNPKKALCLNGTRGRKGPNSFVLDVRSAIALAVIAQMKPYGGMNRDDAIDTVARQMEGGPKEHGKKERTVRRYYDKHQKFAREFVKLYDNSPTLAVAALLDIPLAPDGPTNKQ